jgi:hypothetical protein
VLVLDGGVVTGPPGSAVLVSPIAVGGVDCPTGGIRVTQLSDGGISTVCNGAAGAPGAQGPAGAVGPAGSTGAQGLAGTSTVGQSLPVGNANCPNGGSQFTTGAAVTYACNGAAGATGAAGAAGSMGAAGAAGAAGTNGSNSLWVTNGTTMSYSGGSVGIGTATPSGKFQVLGRVRSGIETGTTDAPTITSGSIQYTGMVTRRVVSLTTTAGSVVARTGDVRLERDGSNGGFRMTWPANGPAIVTVHGIAQKDNGTLIPVSGQSFNQFTGGTIALINDSDSVVFFHLLLGNMYNLDDVTEITLARSVQSSSWVGNIVTTYDQ